MATFGDIIKAYAHLNILINTRQLFRVCTYRTMKPFVVLLFCFALFASTLAAARGS